MNRYAFALTLLATLVVRAQVQVPDAGDDQVYTLSGQIEGKPALAFALLERKGARKLRLNARVAIGDRTETWCEVFASDAPRAVLQDPSSVVDRLIGRTVPTTDLVLTRADGSELEVEVQQGGHTTGRLSGRRLDRPGPDPRDWRSHWLLRGPVARWGIARAFWTVIKPGSRRQEEFRGASDAALSARIAARLDLSREQSTRAIYRAARAETTSDLAALQAAFGFCIDTPALLPRQLPGIPRSEPHQDKYMHFFVSAILAYRSNAQGSLVVGWVKEVLDMRPGGSGYNDQDLFADLLGASFGEALRQQGEIRDY